MSTDLERRLHDELHDRAGDATAWRQGGAGLRRTAAAHRARRLRTAAVMAAAASVVAVVAGISLGTGGPRDGSPGLPNGGPTSTPTGSADDPVRVRVPASVLEKAYSLMAAGRPELVAAATLPRSGDTALVFRGETQESDHRGVVRTVTIHDGEPALGTLAFVGQEDELVAQPARDGAGATLVVVSPPGIGADAAEVTTSLPGKDIRVRRVDLAGRLAMVPIPGPQNVTRLRLLRGDVPLEDRIPGDFYLGSSVPRPLARVVVAAGTGQAVQVRTDGQTACRLTVNGLETPDVVVLPWNPFDEACATVDSSKLQLLIAEDARYSSVAGVAPPGTGFVRLHWSNGNVNEVPVADDEMPAFVDTSGHRPDRLTLAQAIDTAGDETARVEP